MKRASKDVGGRLPSLTERLEQLARKEESEVKYEYIRTNHSGTNTREARQIAEEALGKPLPPQAEVHHVNGDPANNNNLNLVICENHSYHKLLHIRTAALIACGHANWKICWICKKYDKLENLQSTGNGRGFQHKDCAKQYGRERPIQNFCCYCKKQDLPENLQINKANGQCYHKECVALYRQSQRSNQQKKVNAINNLFEDLRALEGGE